MREFRSYGSVRRARGNPRPYREPYTLIFFVLLDGWYLIAGSLVQSFGG